MQPHQERVITEKNELDEKRERLISFVDGEIYRKLDEAEQLRLNRQLKIMALYSDVLAERIDAFVT